MGRFRRHRFVDERNAAPILRDEATLMAKAQALPPTLETLARRSPLISEQREPDTPRAVIEEHEWR